MYKLCHSLGGDDKVTVGSMLCFHCCVSPASWETRVGCIFSWGIVRGNLTYGGLVPESCPTFATRWTVAHQPPLSMGFLRQEYWSVLPFPSPGDLPDPGINPGLLHSRWILYRLSYDWHITTSPETGFCHIWMEEGLSIPSRPVHQTAKWVWLIRMGFPGGSDGKESACNAGDLDSVSELGRSLGEGNGNPLQYSFPENPMDVGAWPATVHGVSKSQLWLSSSRFHLINKKSNCNPNLVLSPSSEPAISSISKEPQSPIPSPKYLFINIYSLL